MINICVLHNQGLPMVQLSKLYITEIKINLNF